LPGVVGHQDDVQRCRVSANQRIERSDRRATRFEPCAHTSVAHRRVAVKARDLERSEEHTSELQSPDHLVCRLLLEKKKPSRSSAWRGYRSWDFRTGTRRLG